VVARVFPVISEKDVTKHLGNGAFRVGFKTRSTPEVWDPKKSGLYKEQLSNKVWLFFPQKHLNLHLFGFQEKFESNRPGKFESNGPFEPIDVAQ
jgi:hypothetical protein